MYGPGTERPAGLLGLFPLFGPGIVGGVQIAADIAWEALRHRGEEATLFCYGRHHHARRIPGVDEHVVATSRTAAIRAALRRRWNPRVLVVWHLGLLRLVPFFRAPRARLVVMLHGVEAWQRHDLITRTLLRRVDLFLSNSNYTWQRFKGAVPYAEALHRTMPLGLGAPRYEQTPEPDPEPTVLMLSRLLRSEDYKGHREVLAAWPRILSRIPGARLWIAGEGDLEPELKRLVRASGIGDSVKFWGFVTNEQKQTLLARCRCLALPSRAEGFGLVYLEAMQAGRPCLTSTNDAGRETVNPPEAGLAVDPGRPDELVDALSRLLTPSPEWDAWSRRARARYEGSFTARHFQERLIAALDLGAATPPTVRVATAD